MRMVTKFLGIWNSKLRSTFSSFLLLGHFIDIQIGYNELYFIHVGIIDASQKAWVTNGSKRKK